MHDLNNERAEEIRRVPVVYRTKDGRWKVFEEAVAVSGLMIKRWHFANMVTLGMREGMNFCDFCKKLEAIRVPSERGAKKPRSELEIIKGCVGEDIHGFLRADPPLRREALARFSWMLPLLNEEVVEASGLPTPFRVVQHTRNIREITEEAAKRMGISMDELKRWQMPFPRSYAAGIYGFVSTLDLDHVGYSFSTGEKLDEEERKRRRRVAVQAYIPMITGACGASLARALPISEILEVTTILSEKPIPAPAHPLHPSYIEEDSNLYESVSRALNSKISMYVWTKERKVEERRSNEGKFELVNVDKPAEGFARIIEQLEKSEG
jgi:CRISPR-associated protein Cas7/Csa2 subtype I-A